MHLWKNEYCKEIFRHQVCTNLREDELDKRLITCNAWMMSPRSEVVIGVKKA